MVKRNHQTATASESQHPDQVAKRVRTDEPLFLGGPDSPMSEIPDEEGAESPGTSEGPAVSVDASKKAVSPAVGTEDDVGSTASATKTDVEGSGVISDAALELLSQLAANPALMGQDMAKVKALLAAATATAAVPTGSGSADGLPTSEVEKPSPATPAAPALRPSSSGQTDDRQKEQAIEVLVELGVARNRVAHWAINDLKRLAVLLGWADTKTDVYNITCAPTKVDWGTPSAFDNCGNLLCHEGTSKPIKFWIPVELAGQWWFDNDGYPAARPAVSGQPLVDNVADFCKTLLNERCMPVSSSKVVEQFGPSQVKASRWMNERGQKGKPAKTHEFKAVYDARKMLRDKVLLQQLNVSQLKLRDIVVLEVQVGRYAVRDEDANDKGKRRAMERWQAFYDLLAVYKLKDAAETVAVAEPASNFSI